MAAGLATRCEVQVAYAIGVARPMGVYVTTFGTGVVDEDKISKVVSELFDFRPRAIIETLDLLRPIYRPTAAYGHFGRPEKTFTWEHTDRSEELRAAVLGAKAKGSAPKSTNGNGVAKHVNGAAKPAPRKPAKAASASSTPSN